MSPFRSSSASASATSVSVAETASAAPAPPPAQATGLLAMLTSAGPPTPLRGMVRLRGSKGDGAKDVYRHSLEDLRRCNDVALERTPAASGDLSIVADVVSRDDRGQTRVLVKQSTAGSIRDKTLVDCVKSALEPRLLDLREARVELGLEFEARAPDVTVNGKAPAVVTQADVEAALRAAGAVDLQVTEATGAERGPRVGVTYRGKRMKVAFSGWGGPQNVVYPPLTGPYQSWRERAFTVIVYSATGSALASALDGNAAVAPSMDELAELLDKVVVVR